MSTRTYSDKKVAYFEKLNRLCETYNKIVVVYADHVGSRQMAKIRQDLRGKGVLLMGKNTMIRTCIRAMESKIPQLEALRPCVKHNIGLIFCAASHAEIRQIIQDNRIPAPARQGVIAPVEVTVLAGGTGLDPGQTSFFQTLGIATKLTKGQIEILTDVNLIKPGDRVTASQSTLLQKLNIKPFSYGLEMRQVYDNGSVYDASVLDIQDSDIIQKFLRGVQNVAALSRQVGLPNEVSVVHSVLEAFKMCVSLVLETDFIFDEMKPIKERLDNPDAYVCETPAAGTAPAATTVQETKEEEPEEEEDEDFGFDLFG